MPSFGEILNDIQSNSKIDTLRRKYIQELSDYTHRNTIVYYSAFLNKPNAEIGIDDDDMNGFMSAVYKLDTSKGLDLILHTPGGSPTAAEAIVDYLRSVFGTDIRVIVPQMAMSAGTLISCAAKEIIMGKHSSLGPIDPQISGIPAYNIVREITEAKDDLNNNTNIAYWQIQLSKYKTHALIYSCLDAIKLSEDLAHKWLKTGMFKELESKEAAKKAKEITEKLNEHIESKNHGRHFNAEYCKKMGLNIMPLEEDDNLQEKVLSIHHTCILTFSITPAVKIIENSNNSYIKINRSK